MFNIHKDHPPSVLTRQVPYYIVPPDDSLIMSFFFLSLSTFFVLMVTVQTVSTAHMSLCQRVVKSHTIIDSHSSSCSSEPLDTLFVPIKIIILGILPGFISSTIRNSWAIVAPPKAITVVIQEVLKFWSTLTKLSPSIRCHVHSGGCYRFTAGFQVD